MVRTLRAVASLLIGLGGVGAMAWAVYVLLQTGTCGSGGPYEIANPCPPGSTVVGFLLMGGFFAWFVGLFLSNNGIVAPGTGQIIWCALFLGGGIALLVLALTDTDPADSTVAGYLMAAVFIPIGLVGAIAPFWAARHTNGAEPASEAIHPPVPPG